MILGIRPILSALLRNRSGALLVALQIAIALAIGVNAIYVVQQRIVKMSQPTGIDDANLFTLESDKLTERFNYDASVREDLTYLRSVPGVVAATLTNSAPFALAGWTALWSQPRMQGRKAKISWFTLDEQGVKTLGAHLIAGRDFRAEEILPPQPNAGPPPQILLTRAAAERLFPHQNALGRTVYQDEKSATVIGILDDMIGNGLGWNDGSVFQVAIFPERPSPLSVGYLVRAQPGRRDEIMQLAQEHLAASNPDRVITNVHSLQYFKESLYLNDRAMGTFLITVTALLLAVAALGIFSLATFNVSTRTKQIGTRRAVGARRIDIVGHFLLENTLITSAGVVAGCLAALGVGLWLSLAYALPRLPLYYLVGGVLVLWMVSLLAAWQPARRAAAVPPSVATRTV
jgi:putative ABC transport system permease protein